MKALVLTTSWPMARGNTSGSFVRDLLRGLVTAGWAFEVVTPALAATREPLAAERGIEVHPAPYWGETWNGGLAHRRGLPETLASEPWKWALVPGLWLAMERAARRRIEHAERCGLRFDAL